VARRGLDIRDLGRAAWRGPGGRAGLGTSLRTRAIVLPHWAKVALTFHVVTPGWIFFRAASFGDALAYLGGIVPRRPARSPSPR
jgi:hypothetical protein